MLTIHPGRRAHEFNTGRDVKDVSARFLGYVLQHETKSRVGFIHPPLQQDRLKHLMSVNLAEQVTLLQPDLTKAPTEGGNHRCPGARQH